jgi:hypothetical protein
VGICHPNTFVHRNAYSCSYKVPVIVIQFQLELDFVEKLQQTNIYLMGIGDLNP